jgi:tRNA(fMet)-specific endonuclease VapC
MYLLDTDHLSILERGGASALNLTLRLSAVPDGQVVSCIVVYEEQMRGWLAEGGRVQTSQQWIRSYENLTANLRIHCNLTLLPFNALAAEQFDALKKAKVNIGTNDLKIAAIALANNATVLTRNSRHFGKVPNLPIEDWTV